MTKKKKYTKSNTSYSAAGAFYDVGVAVTVERYHHKHRTGSSPHSKGNKGGKHR